MSVPEMDSAQAAGRAEAAGLAEATGAAGPAEDGHETRERRQHVRTPSADRLGGRDRGRDHRPPRQGHRAAHVDPVTGGVPAPSRAPTRRRRRAPSGDGARAARRRGSSPSDGHAAAGTPLDFLYSAAYKCRTHERRTQLPRTVAGRARAKYGVELITEMLHNAARFSGTATRAAAPRARASPLPSRWP